MAAPAIASSSTDKTGTMATEITATFAIDGPSGITAGDLLVLMVTCRGDLSNTPTFGVVGGGAWDKRQESILGSGSNRPGAAIYTRISDGTETTVTTVTTPGTATLGMCAKVLRITGHDPVSWLNTSGTTAGDTTTGVGNPYVITGVTTTADQCKVIFLAADAISNVLTHTWTGGATEQGDFGADPGSASMLSWAFLDKTPAGATGNQSVEPSATGTGAGVVLAVAPAAAVTARDADRRLVMGVG